MTLAQYAIEYAEAGWEVFPLKPDKTPIVSQYQASSNEKIVYGWWDSWPDALIGHRVADGIVLMDIDPRHGGKEVWDELRDTYGNVKTRFHFSGRNDGGGHVWWRCALGEGERFATGMLDAWAEAQGLGHDAGGRWTAGIDLLQHNHRYTILPPSPHPETGEPYRWGTTVHEPIAELPGWLRAYIVAQAPVVAPKPAVGALGPLLTPAMGDGPISAYKATHRFADVLTGWELIKGDGDSDGSYWRYDGASAKHSASVKGGRLYVHTPNTAFDPTGHGDPHGYDVFDCYRVLRFGRGEDAQDRALESLRPVPLPVRVDGNSEQVTRSSWLPIDIRPLLAAGYSPPLPSVLVRSDGSHLFYGGRVNGIHGESGSGKSWIALVATAQEIGAGHNVVYVDLEDHASSVIARLLALGCSARAIGDHFRYVAPVEAYGIMAQTALVPFIDDERPSLMVIDSTGEAMALDAMKQNDDDAVAGWFRKLPRAIAEMGPAVIVVDHIPKAKDAPSLYAIGSQRKRASIDGVAYRVDASVAPARGRTGYLRLICAKDRNGFYQTGENVAKITITANESGDSVDIAIDHAEHVKRPTTLMERISKRLEGSRALTTNEVKSSVEGKDTGLKWALEVLVGEGFVAAMPDGNRVWYSSLKPYRVTDDELLATIRESQ